MAQKPDSKLTGKARGAKPRPAGSKHPSRRVSKAIDAANRIRPESAVDGGPAQVFFRSGVDDF